MRLLHTGQALELEQAQAIFDAAQLKVDLRNEICLAQSRLFVLTATNPKTAVVAALLCWRVADELEVIDVAVEPQFRRQGLATRLLQEAFQHEQGARSAFLEVRSSNLEARALYIELGFRLNGHRKSYYSDGEDAALYCLQLLNRN